LKQWGLDEMEERFSRRIVDSLKVNPETRDLCLKKLKERTEKNKKRLIRA